MLNFNFKKKNIFFSIVVCIYKKDYKFYNLFKSLNLQTFKNFEVILVDQNNFLLNINKKLFKFDIKHIKSKKGLSLSRNQGLKFSKGNYISFPDDDCLYHRNTLLNAYKSINKTKSQVVTGRTIDKNYKNTLLNYPKKKTHFHKINIVKDMCSVTFFIKKNNLRFDTSLGLGSERNISGEETDYLFRIKESLNYKIFYDPNILIFHDNFNNNLPNKNNHNSFFIKSYSYGLGSSIVLKKNNLKILNILIIFKIILNFVLSLLKFKYTHTKFIFYNLVGRIRGIFS